MGFRIANVRAVQTEAADYAFGSIRPTDFVISGAMGKFEVKDSNKYAATGGWGFGHFNKDGTLGNDALMKTCFPCHAKASRDFVFTEYAP